MNIEWIGTGSGLNPILGNTSFLAKGTGDRTLLVDCGFTVPPELLKAGRFNEVTDVVFTHPHGDHMGGLEGFGFMSYFALKKKDDKRPNLYVATADLAEMLWEHQLKGAMEKAQDDTGKAFNATLNTYFHVHIGLKLNIPGIPSAVLFSTPHVQNMESYGLRFENGVFYSGDTVRAPPADTRVNFQDCQFFESPGDVHISYNKLNRELTAAVKGKTYLVHLGGGWDKVDCKADGFAGYVRPGDKFTFD